MSELSDVQGWQMVAAEFARVPDSADVGAIIFDLDWFMGFNDSYGHVAGDELLAKVERIITQSLRDNGSGVCIRAGGEEFVVILHGAGAPARALELAEGVRSTLFAMNLPFEHEEVRTGGRVTLSAGVVTPNEPRKIRSDLEDAVRRAKVAGRNRVAS